MVGGPRDGQVVSPVMPGCDEMAFPLDGETAAWIIYRLREGTAEDPAPFDFSHQLGPGIHDGLPVRSRSRGSGPRGRLP